MRPHRFDAVRVWFVPRGAITLCEGDLPTVCTFGFSEPYSLNTLGRDCLVEPELFKIITEGVFSVYGSHYTLSLGICQPLKSHT